MSEQGGFPPPSPLRGSPPEDISAKMKGFSFREQA